MANERIGEQAKGVAATGAAGFRLAELESELAASQATASAGSNLLARLARANGGSLAVEGVDLPLDGHLLSYHVCPDEGHGLGRCRLLVAYHEGQDDTCRQCRGRPLAVVDDDTA